MTLPGFSAAATLMMALATTRPVLSQEAATTTAVPAVDQYDSVFQQLRHLAPSSARVATVRNLTLRRDVLTLVLEDGTLVEATPVAGRPVAAVFVGRGYLKFTPPLPMEQTEMKRLLGDSALATIISAVTFVCTDSTLAELERSLRFTAGAVPAGAEAAVRDAADWLLDGHTHEVAVPHLMGALLNGEASGFFYAHIKQEHGEDLAFAIDPREADGVELLRHGRERGERVQLVSEFPRAADLADSAAQRSGDRDPLMVESYRIDATIAKGLGFAATVTLRLTARSDAGPWARLLLFRELHVDSLRGDTGVVTTFHRSPDGTELWVRFQSPFRPGETRVIRVSYHGDLIAFGSMLQDLKFRYPEAPIALDRWFMVKSPSFWFPRYGYPWQSADVELLFRTPKQYRFATIGRLLDSTAVGDTFITHWRTERPATEVCFNIGEFQEYHITDPRIPPVTVQINTDAHRQLNSLMMLGQRDPAKDVAGDVATSLSFFSRVFGPPMFAHYYATEIPEAYGEAFPGLMYLSVFTFQTVNERGDEEMFRAHEMAHQWWGIGVEPAGSRDNWLYEGFAEFSGLWYMQMVLRDNDKFFKHLRDWRDAIHSHRHNSMPIALGWRIGANGYDSEYSLIVYEKGAWVLQMLRNMMIDFRTMKEDAFTAMMQDYYRQYRGRRASTHDFQRVVERHTGIAMDWFFDEWVNGTAIPTYILSWTTEPDTGGRSILRIRVRQEDVPPDFVMPVPLRIDFADSSHVYVRVNVRGASAEGTLKLPLPPTHLELNPLESVLAEVKTEGWH